MTKLKNFQAIKLCQIDEIPLDGVKGFKINSKGSSLQIFIVRKGSNIYAYHNKCPHMGTSLDWQPDNFLDSSGELIQCSTHGALFRIQDGLCISGPCINQSLAVITTEVQENDIICFIPNARTHYS